MIPAKEIDGELWIRASDMRVKDLAGQELNLRDYFAARAMQGLIHHFDFATFKSDPMRLAGWSYDAADAMIKAREK
jgi:hypothetical protein